MFQAFAGPRPHIVETAYLLTGGEINYRGGFHKVLQGICTNPGTWRSFRSKSSD